MNNFPSILKIISMILLLSTTSAVEADENPVFKLSVDKTMSEVYENVYKSLEDARFYVVFEPNIGKNLEKFSQRWGDEYNQNKLTGLRSMVFCNVWYANQISNKDPDMLGLCPLHLTLYEKAGKTTVLFNRPTVVSKSSDSHELFEEIENNVISAIKKGML